MSIEAMKDLLTYDAETGQFWWTEKAPHKVRNKPANAKDKLGYVCIKIQGKMYKAHRIAWMFCHGKWPEKSIDHINGNPSDNRICNLREVSHAVNLQNIRKPRSDNTIGLMGVIPNGTKWRAQVKLNGKKIDLGTYTSKEEAHQAYLVGKRKYHEGCTI